MLTGQDLRQMYIMGAQRLEKHVNRVDALNVFPVPDGDTGTNMNLTIQSGVEELRRSKEETAEKVAAVFSRGLLMGARGNSGVILSQLFRGFAKGLSGLQEVDGRQLAESFQHGVEMAYKAVMKPVEGTILTVAREAAAAAKRAARGASPAEVIEALVHEARKALDNTPNQLPVLKEVGVVDSGGQGLVYIYEGFLYALKEGIVPEETGEPEAVSEADLTFGQAREEIHHIVNPADIQHGYCTEFMVHLSPAMDFSEVEFREKISSYGDSLLVVSDDDLVKVHIHAEEPGDVLTFAHKFGLLDRIKIENMRLQHKEVLRKQEERRQHASEVEEMTEVISTEPSSLPPQPGQPRAPYSIIGVVSGKGIEDIFRSLGVDTVIKGGQTMNPSTEQFVKAIESCKAERVLILPNNKNIIMAAEQAAQLVDIPVAVIPSKTVPQGMSAMLSFDPASSLDDNKEKMSASLAYVKTGQVTYAVRDTTMNDLTIREGDYIGISDGEIVASGSDRCAVAEQLLGSMTEDGGELITVLYGEGVKEAEMDGLEQKLRADYTSYEVEIHNGGQPLYSFIISVE